MYANSALWDLLSLLVLIFQLLLKTSPVSPSADCYAEQVLWSDPKQFDKVNPLTYSCLGDDWSARSWHPREADQDGMLRCFGFWLAEPIACLLG